MVRSLPVDGSQDQEHVSSRKGRFCWSIARRGDEVAIIYAQDTDATAFGTKLAIHHLVIVSMCLSGPGSNVECHERRCMWRCTYSRCRDSSAVAVAKGKRDPSSCVLPLVVEYMRPDEEPSLFMLVSTIANPRQKQGHGTELAFPPCLLSVSRPLLQAVLELRMTGDCPDEESIDCLTGRLKTIRGKLRRRSDTLGKLKDGLTTAVAADEAGSPGWAFCLEAGAGLIRTHSLG